MEKSAQLIKAAEQHPSNPPRRKRYSWTAEDDQFLRKNHGLMTYSEIAAHLGKSRWVCVKNAKWLGISASQPRWTKKDDANMRKFYVNLPIEEIAVRLG